jgi:hypothetical protein
MALYMVIERFKNGDPVVPSENLIGVFVNNPKQLFDVRLRANADHISASTQWYDKSSADSTQRRCRVALVRLTLSTRERPYVCYAARRS